MGAVGWVEGFQYDHAVVFEAYSFEGGVVSVDVDGHDAIIYEFVAAFYDCDGAVFDFGLHAVTGDAEGEVLFVAV